MAGLFICAINIFYTVVGFFAGWYLASVISIISVLLLCFAWYLVYRKKVELTFHIIMVYAYVFLFLFSYLFGETTQSNLYFFFVPVAVAIMFDKKAVMLFYLFLTILTVIAIRLMFKTEKPYYETGTELLPFFGYMNSVYCIALIYIGVTQFKRENQNYSEEIEKAREFIEQKNKEITDSIHYASRIQKAIIPATEEFISCFEDAFVLLKPRDIVSGDFYWCAVKGDNIYFAVADCTGHGVPGGFMTMLGISFLDEIINEKNETEPGKILDMLREKIIASLRQTGATGENKDGMDIVFCRYNKTESNLYFSGANNALYMLRNGTISEHKGNKQPCGFYHKPEPFTTESVAVYKGDLLYLFTDGFPDQFGGVKGKKYKYRQLEQKIIALAGTGLNGQKLLLDNEFQRWKGDYEQVDDVLVCGIMLKR